MLPKVMMLRPMTAQVLPRRPLRTTVPACTGHGWR
jgi:hypothetical protein